MAKKPVTKMTAPSNAQHTEEPKKEAKSIAAPKMAAPANGSKEDLKRDEAAKAKAEKLQKKLDKKAKKENNQKEEKLIHFHFFRFLILLILFVIATISMYFEVQQLLGNSAFGVTMTLSENAILVVGFLFMIEFAIWMAIFELGWRRFFRIGYYERLRKAEAKLAKKQAKKNK